MRAEIQIYNHGVVGLPNPLTLETNLTLVSITNEAGVLLHAPNPENTGDGLALYTKWLTDGEKVKLNVLAMDAHL